MIIICRHQASELTLDDSERCRGNSPRPLKAILHLIVWMTRDCAGDSLMKADRKVSSAGS